jgi:hypothetical protein
LQLVHAQQQPQHGALAAAAWPHQGHHLHTTKTKIDSSVYFCPGGVSQFEGFPLPSISRLLALRVRVSTAPSQPAIQTMDCFPHLQASS